LLLRKREIVVFADTPFHFLPPSCPHCTAFYGFAELEINFLDPFVDYLDILSFARSFHGSVYDASYNIPRQEE